MKYRKVLDAYEKQVKNFASATTYAHMLSSIRQAQHHAMNLRQMEMKRRNGRKRTQHEIQYRRNGRLKDLQKEFVNGTYQTCLPVYPKGMPVTIRCGAHFLPYEILHCEPGKMIVISRGATKTTTKTLTFRLLRKRKNNQWFGLWIEENNTCEQWHQLDKSFHLNLNLDTTKGRYIGYTWPRQWYPLFNPLMGSLRQPACYIVNQTLCYYPTPFGF